MFERFFRLLPSKYQGPSSNCRCPPKTLAAVDDNGFSTYEFFFQAPDKINSTIIRSWQTPVGNWEPHEIDAMLSTASFLFFQFKRFNFFLCQK